MFQKVQGHRYCNLGVFFSLAFENTDIPCKDNEVVPDLRDTVIVYVASPRLVRMKFTSTVPVHLTAKSL
jgi:hypothetical protein